MTEFLEICGKGEKAIAQNDDQQAAKIKVAVNKEYQQQRQDGQACWGE